MATIEECVHVCALMLLRCGANRLMATCLNQHHISQRHTAICAHKSAYACMGWRIVRHEGLQVIIHLSHMTEPGDEKESDVKCMTE